MPAQGTEPKVSEVRGFHQLEAVLDDAGVALRRGSHHPLLRFGAVLFTLIGVSLGK